MDELLERGPGHSSGANNPLEMFENSANSK